LLQVLHGVGFQSTLFGKFSATSPDATQHSKIFQVSFTDAKRSDSENSPNARPSCLDVYLLWKELRYSGKAVAEDHPDDANFRPDANSPESDFE
jgi:hypothetical protein